MASLQKKPNGYWYAVMEQRDASGKRKQVWVSLKTKKKKEAKDKLIELEGQQLHGTFIKPDKTTVAEFLHRWLNDHAAVNVRARTLEGYRDKLEGHVIPAIGSLALKDLRPEAIQSLYQKLLTSGRKDGKGGLAPRTVLHIHRIFSEALNFAVKWGLLAKNPADVVTPPRPRRHEMKVIDEVGVHRLLERAKVEMNGFYYALIHLDMFTGMRRSELLGLRWKDVDLDFGMLSIVQTLHLPKGYKEPIFEDAKTEKSRRNVALSPASVGALRKHKERMLEIRQDIGLPWSEDSLVFCHPDTGKPLLPNTVTHAYIKIARRAVVDARLHDLRHSHATLMLKAGIHPKVVQERLGHSNISMTLDTYSHVVPGIQEAAALKFEEGLRLPAPQPESVAVAAD